MAAMPLKPDYQVEAQSWTAHPFFSLMASKGHTVQSRVIWENFIKMALPQPIPFLSIKISGMKEACVFRQVILIIKALFQMQDFSNSHFRFPPIINYPSIWNCN